MSRLGRGSAPRPAAAFLGVAAVAFLGVATVLLGLSGSGAAQDAGTAARGVPAVGFEASAVGSDGSAAAGDASVADFAWLAGTWRGVGPGGAVAEIHYMEPSAGVLPSVFRLVGDGRVVVLELITLAEEEDGVRMYVRHFSPALVPGEEEHPITLRLVEGGEDRWVFENVREGNPTVGVLTRTGPDAFVSASELRRPDGSVDTLRVEYERIP